MRGKLLLLGVAFLSLAAAPEASAQKSGGILRITHRDSPASMSIHEEGTISVVLPMMGSTNSSCSTSTYVRPASKEWFPTSPKNGHGAKTARSSLSY